MHNKIELKISRYIFVVVCITAFALCLAPVCLAQQYTLIGAMEMKTGETFPYKIVFTETDGNISGFSYTFAAPQETKSVIRGSIDRFSRKLIFKETEIVSSVGVRTKAFMCLVNAHLLYEQSYKGASLTGDVTNRQTDKTACTPGTLVFNNAEELQPLFKPKEQFDTVITMKKRVPSPEHKGIKVAAEEATIEPPTGAEKITAGDIKAYDWYSDSLVIDIWDGGNTDGDKVSIEFNGNRVLPSHYLSKEKKRLSLLVPPNKTSTLSIIAENEGSDPPNTATICLTDGTTKHRIVAYNTRGQRATVTIKKKP